MSIDTTINSPSSLGRELDPDSLNSIGRVSDASDISDELEIAQRNEPEEPSNEVTKKLKVVLALNELKDNISKINPHKKIPEKLAKIVLELNNKYSEVSGKPPIPLNNVPESLKLINTLLEGNKITVSNDISGHGGTRQVTLLTDQGTKYLFLKPRDRVEATNYKIINAIEPELASFMPEIYGEVEIGGVPYLIMENVRMSAEGIPLKQLVDAKLAGKVPLAKGFNPIANIAELAATDKKKSTFDFFQMKKGAEKSPDYMVYKGAMLARFFNFSKSERNLLNSLEGVSFEHLNRLLDDLETIRFVLENSSVAFIGASIALIKNLDGSIRPLLIDPAHMQVDPEKRPRVEFLFRNEPEQPLVYYGNKEDFQKQKTSNSIALKSMSYSIKKLPNYQNEIPEEQSSVLNNKDLQVIVQPGYIKEIPEEVAFLDIPLEILDNHIQ